MIKNISVVIGMVLASWALVILTLYIATQFIILIINAIKG